MWQSKVLLSTPFTSAMELKPGALPDGRLLSESYVQRRLVELTESGPHHSGEPTRRMPQSAREMNAEERHQKHRLRPNEQFVKDRAERAQKERSQWLNEAKNEVSASFESPQAPRATRSNFSQLADSKSALDLRRAGPTSFSAPQHTSPVAQAAANFLHSPDSLRKDPSHRSLAQISTKASLGDCGASLADIGGSCVADVWNECLREVNPQRDSAVPAVPPEWGADAHHVNAMSGMPWSSLKMKHSSRFPPEPPPPQESSPPVPRGLSGMIQHSGPQRKGAPYGAEAPCHGTPIRTPRWLPPITDGSTEPPTKAPRTLVAPRFLVGWVPLPENSAG